MSGLQILAVEVDGPRARQFEERLRAAGHTVTLVRSGADGLAALFLHSFFEVCLIGPGVGAAEAADFLAALRELEAGQRDGEHTIVLECGEQTRFPQSDGALVPDFDAAGFATAVAAAAGARDRKSDENLSLFEPDGFREQCVEETGLMIEIIDLFAQESERELPEMSEALESGDYDRLYRLAHTIKGSLGALHAPRARQQAFELESAARNRDEAGSMAALSGLTHEIEELQVPLRAFRQLCCQG